VLVGGRGTDHPPLAFNIPKQVGEQTLGWNPRPSG
jgi:hypothetical protein